MPSSQDMQDLEDEMDHYADRAAALSRLLKKADGRIAELEAQRDALLAACELGDVLGADGPALLEYAAAVIERVSANTAWELRRKAKAERAAIAKARGEAAG